MNNTLKSTGKVGHQCRRGACTKIVGNLSKQHLVIPGLKKTKNKKKGIILIHVRDTRV